MTPQNPPTPHDGFRLATGVVHPSAGHPGSRPAFPRGVSARCSQQNEETRVQSIIRGCARGSWTRSSARGRLFRVPRGYSPRSTARPSRRARQSGHLDKILERSRDTSRSREQIRRRSPGSAMYPIVLPSCAWGSSPACWSGSSPRSSGVRGQTKGQASLHPVLNRHSGLTARIRPAIC